LKTFQNISKRAERETGVEHNVRAASGMLAAPPIKGKRTR
jgi:hypothetical protein